jgi:penicillin-insensitive murein endopeptidase
MRSVLRFQWGIRALAVAAGCASVVIYQPNTTKAQIAVTGFPQGQVSPPEARKKAKRHLVRPPVRVRAGTVVKKSSRKVAPAVAAKTLFGAVKSAAPLKARAIGTYARGCLAGGKALPVDGSAWQAMRLSRNRNWGHPVLVAWLERFAKATKSRDGWPGLLVGDMAQPRGGPMLTGHASHQLGLDADIWLTPMPNRKLSRKEREDLSAVSMLASDKLSVDPAKWSDARARIIKRAASTSEVERIFVHPAIKKKLCESASSLGKDRKWLSKVRPWWGHHYHFHVRIGCPSGSPGCKPQPSVGSDDGCGKELDGWFKILKRSLAPKPTPPVKPAKPPKPKPPMTIDALPNECRAVLAAGDPPAVVKAGLGLGSGR